MQPLSVMDFRDSQHRILEVSSRASEVLIGVAETFVVDVDTKNGGRSDPKTDQKRSTLSPIARRGF